MALRIYIYEDKNFHRFFPLTYLRPVSTLRAGILPLYRRAERHFPGAEISLVTRTQIASLVSEQNPDVPVNILKREQEDVLFLNGAIRSFGDLAQCVTEARIATRFAVAEETAALLLPAFVVSDVPTLATPANYLKVVAQQAGQIAVAPTSATMYHYCWELVDDIGPQIRSDFEYLAPTTPRPERLPSGAHLINAEAIHLGEGTTVCPGAVIDASQGPVFIDANCRVDPQAAIYGPCCVGQDTAVVAGKLVHSSIGHTCRVGGEVESSIFHSAVNKYHAGFIGHSYVGSWVNFGAMTTNSDLKNNYSTIRVSLGGRSIDTGSIKVGSFIGDHTKFGIGTLLNTGINIGVCCNIFGGSLVSDKEVPSFSWGTTGAWDRYDPEKAIDTARRTTRRRDLPLSDREAHVLRDLAAGRFSADGAIDFGELIGA